MVNLNGIQGFCVTSGNTLNCRLWVAPSETSSTQKPLCIFPAFCCCSGCRLAGFGRLCPLWEEWVWSVSQLLTMFNQAKSVLCISTCLHGSEVSRRENLCECVSRLTVNLWWSWLQSIPAGFWDWLLRKCKSSSWPAFPFPLLCWEESLWLLIVQIWLSFTLKDKIFTDGLWNLCSFKKYSWSLWPELKGHTDPLIYLNKYIYMPYVQIFIRLLNGLWCT